MNPSSVSLKTAWHALPADQVLLDLATARGGLSDAEVARRLAMYGPNQLRPPRRHGPVVRFLLQFHNILIYVLLATAAVTALLGHAVDTGVILETVQEPLSLWERGRGEGGWGLFALAGFAVFLLVELEKAFWRWWRQSILIPIPPNRPA